MDSIELKKKLRKLKKEEIRIRTNIQHLNSEQYQLVWDRFFSFSDSKPLYSFAKLAKFTHDERKEVFELFFLEVYITYYKEMGFSLNDLINKGYLVQFGLPVTATIDDIKKKFRDLVKKHHPDKGGNQKDFIEMIEVYEKLINK